jgi:hypothetical protein
VNEALPWLEPADGRNLTDLEAVETFNGNGTGTVTLIKDVHHSSSDLADEEVVARAWKLALNPQGRRWALVKVNR